MKIILFLVLTIACIQSKLVFVNSQYRHGARGTFNGQYLNNTTPVDNYWIGELTPVGQRQHYVLGQTLKQQYIQSLAFLDPQYNQDQFKVRASDVNRTLQSAESQLYGLFANGFGPEIPNGLDPELTIPPYEGATPITDLGDDALPHLYQPIPITTVYEDIDPLLFPVKPLVCPKYDEIYDAWKNEPEQQLSDFELNEEFSKTAEEISNILYQSVQVSSFGGIRDNIICDLNAGLQADVPEQLMPGTDLSKQIDYVSDLFSFDKMNCPECRKIANTNLFQKYISNFDNAISGTSQRWYMVSAHDTNLEYVMPFLNLTSTQCITEFYKTGQTKALNCNGKPQFAANLIMELHVEDDKEGSKDEDDYYVKLIFNGVEQNVCEKEQKTCVYSEFKQRVLGTIYSKEELGQVCGVPNQQIPQEQTTLYDIGRDVVAFQLEQEKKQQKIQVEEKIVLQQASSEIENNSEEQSFITDYFLPIIASQILILIGIFYKTFKF